LAFAGWGSVALEDIPLKVKACAIGLIFPDYDLTQSALMTSDNLHFANQNIDGLNINNHRQNLFS